MSLKKSEKFLLGCQALADRSVTDIAKEAQISRTSVYAAKNQVIQFAQSLDECSQDSQTVEITEEFLERMVLSLSLDCHSSLEGIQRFAGGIRYQEARNIKTV